MQLINILGGDTKENLEILNKLIDLGYKYTPNIINEDKDEKNIVCIEYLENNKVSTPKVFGSVKHVMLPSYKGNKELRNLYKKQVFSVVTTDTLKLLNLSKTLKVEFMKNIDVIINSNLDINNKLKMIKGLGGSEDEILL